MKISAHHLVLGEKRYGREPRSHKVGHQLLPGLLVCLVLER